VESSYRVARGTGKENVAPGQNGCQVPVLVEPRREAELLPAITFCAKSGHEVLR